jgi:tetratricopeptide (TPR) repeat protein
MADPITLSAALIPIAQNFLSEGIVRSFDRILRRTPIHKAVRSTSDKFQTRCSDLQAALERWVQSERFKTELEDLGGGQPGTTDAEHVDQFIVESGLQHGAVSFETARDVLVFLYTQLYAELCASDEGPKVLGAQLLALNRNVERILDRLPPEETGMSEAASSRYSPRPDLDTEPRAVSNEDREAEVQLNLIRQLVDRRQGRSGLQLLTELEPKIDSGLLSASVRARYFINKGVCHVVCGELEVAKQEFERARTLDPKNPKALINLAQVALLQKDHVGALELTTRVLETSPKDANGCSLQLACLHELGRAGELESFLSSRPWILEESACLYTVAYIAFDEGRFEEAEHYLRRHNEIEPEFAEAWGLLGSSILVPAQHLLREEAAAPNLIPAQIRDRIAEAELCFSKEEQLLTGCDGRRDLAATYANRGVCRMLLSRFDEARRDLQRALEISPSLDEVRRNLGTLYLHLGQAQEAINVFDEITDLGLCRGLTLQRAAAYLDAGRPAEARRLLEARLHEQSGPEAILLTDLLLIACHRLRDPKACEARVSDLESRAGEDPEVYRVLAQHRLRAGEKVAAIATMKRAVEVATEVRRSHFRLILAGMFYYLEQYAESADEYERVPVRADDSPDSRRYVGALYAAGRLAKAVELARAVRGARSAVPDFSEIEALVLERSGNLTAANELRQALLNIEITPARQRLKMAGNLTRLGQSSEARLLIAAVSIVDVADEPELLFESARLRTVLGLPDALECAYRFLRIEFENPEAHLFYIGTFFRREKIDDPSLNPRTLGLHCSLVLRHGSETQRYTLVDGEGDITVNDLGNSHPLSVSLMGRSVGDKFRYPEDSPAEAEYEIVQVQSKYVFAFQDCLSHFNERFPSHSGLTRMEVKPDDPTNIVVMMEAQRARSEKALEMYNTGSAPACTLARLLGRSDAELFLGLISDSATRVMSSLGIAANLHLELAQIGSASAVLVETSALVTLEWLGLLAKLKERFDCVQVTQQTLDAIVETGANMHPEKRTGSMFSDSPGHIQFVEHNSEEIRAQQQFYERIVAFLRSAAQVVMPTPGPALSEFERYDLRATLGWAAASTIAAASVSGTLVYSDDLALRLVSRHDHKVQTFWSQTLLQDLVAKGLISAAEYDTALCRLVEARFHFVSVNKADLIWVVRSADWRPTPAVTRMIGLLAGPDCALGDAVNIALDVLHEIWAEVIPRESKLVMLDLFVQVLITRRNGSTVLQALRRRNANRSLIWTTATGEIQRGIEAWFLARNRGLVPDAPSEGILGRIWR